MVSLQNTQVEDVPDANNVKNAFKIVTAEVCVDVCKALMTQEKSFVVYTDTKEEKYHWLKMFNELTTGNGNLKI